MDLDLKLLHFAKTPRTQLNIDLMWFDGIFDILTVESLAEISNYSRGTFIPTWLSFLG